jgi:hypothetical protein
VSPLPPSSCVGLADLLGTGEHARALSNQTASWNIHSIETSWRDQGFSIVGDTVLARPVGRTRLLVAKLTATITFVFLAVVVVAAVAFATGPHDVITEGEFQLMRVLRLYRSWSATAAAR